MKNVYLAVILAQICCAALVACGDSQTYSSQYSTACQPGKYNILLKTAFDLAEKGDTEAQYHIGLKYAEGQGLCQSYKHAAKWFRKAATQGHPKAQFNLAVLYLKGKGLPQDYKQAVNWFRKAAAQGNARAQFQLAVMYGRGWGVPENDNKSVRWLRSAAKQGMPRAQSSLALLYLDGKGGVPQNYQQAARWYREAAKKGYAPAQTGLALLYGTGRGVPQNYQQAAKWAKKAAEQGNAAGMFALGAMYREGQSVPKNYVVAYALFNLSAATNPSAENPAIKARDTLLLRMTENQIEAGQQLTREMSRTAHIGQAIKRPTGSRPIGQAIKRPTGIDHSFLKRLPTRFSGSASSRLEGAPRVDRRSPYSGRPHDIVGE